jgi:hypothetical protein
VLGVVVLLIVLVGALVFGGFFNSPSTTRGPSELADLTPDAASPPMRRLAAPPRRSFSSWSASTRRR